MMHARRRFKNAWELSGKKEGLASQGLKKIQKLYSLENGFKKRGMSFEERYEARKKELQPKLEELRNWCEKKAGGVPSSSKLGNALRYFCREYNELSGFLKDGRYEIDNGWVERVIRKFAIGRKNWLFSDTVKGAESSSLLYSLIVTIKMNEKDPFKVLTEILREIPKAKTLEDYEKLARMMVKKTAI